MAVVELIWASGCPNAKPARVALVQAFRAARLQPTWKEWRTDDPEAADHVRGLGSPTILVDGVDVAGKAASGPGCRLYAAGGGQMAGVPPVEQITAALRLAAPGSKGQWQTVLGALPGVGLALLPKGLCPACWPAYAGVLSALGLGFLMETKYLLPLTALFLCVAVGSLAWNARWRRGYRPFLLGALAGTGVLVGKFGFDSDVAMYSGVGLLVGASVWNAWPVQVRTPVCPACVGPSGAA